MRKGRLETVKTGIEKELFDALERLKAGIPKQPDLQKKVRLKRLRINATTVAREAGRARTLIGHDGCAYPRVRAAIKALEDRSGPVTSFEDVNRKLREENADLRKTIKISMSQVAAVLRRMETLDSEIERKIKEATRIAKGKGFIPDSNQIVGTSLLKKENDNVVSFSRVGKGLSLEGE